MVGNEQKHIYKDSLAVDSVLANNIYLKGKKRASGIIIGTFGDTKGNYLSTKNWQSVAVFSEIPAAGAVLTSGDVIVGTWNRMLVNKAQTADCSIYGVQNHCRVKAGGGSVTVGSWNYYEGSGTYTSALVCAGASCSVEFPATTTVSSGSIMCGLLIDTAGIGNLVNAGAKYTAIMITTDLAGASGKTAWKYGIEFGSAAISTAVIKFDAAISNVVAVSGAVTTQAGYILIAVGSQTAKIALYDVT